jgi:Staphylococcal nuclease homologue
VLGKEVTLQTFAKDKYRRTLADVLLADGTNVNHELVKDDWGSRYGHRARCVRQSLIASPQRVWHVNVKLHTSMTVVYIPTPATLLLAPTPTSD